MPAAFTPINGDGHTSLDAIDQMAVQIMEDRKIPGATVAVSIGSRLVYSKAFGFANAESREPMETTHRTRIGSVSKIITTAAVMKLHESPGNDFNINRLMYGPQGLFNSGEYQAAIQHSADKFGVGAPMVTEWYHQIQVSHLLSHCAGWKGSGNRTAAAAMFGVDPDEVTPRHNHLWFVKNRTPIAPPGYLTKYGNRNVGIMDHVIETVSGQTYIDFVRDEILHPAGLHQVASINQAVSALDSSPHKYINDGAATTPYVLKPKPGTGAAGGWRATASDLVKLTMAMDKSQGRPDILEPPTVGLMEMSHFQTPKARALGWGIKNKGAGAYLAHNGSVGGGGTYLRRFLPGYIANSGADMADVSIAVCCNIRNASAAKSITGKAGTIVSKADVPFHYNLLPALVLGLAR